MLLNFFLGLSRRCHHAPAKASSSTPPDIYPPPKRKYENPSLAWVFTASQSVLVEMGSFKFFLG
jgi:hypothetical protein